LQRSRARRFLAEKRQQMSEAAHRKIKADEFLTPPLKMTREGSHANGMTQLQRWLSFGTFL